MKIFTLEEALLFARLIHVHPNDQCRTWICVMHNPAEGPWRDMTPIWRSDRGIFERICPHGVGHPDPSQFQYWELVDQTWQAIHGCCSGMCCEGWYRSVLGD